MEGTDSSGALLRMPPVDEKNHLALDRVKSVESHYQESMGY